MHILTIGYSLPNQSVDNHTVLNAPSITDYDAAFIDPEAITQAVQQLLDGERPFNAQDGRPVVNGRSQPRTSSCGGRKRRSSSSRRGERSSSRGGRTRSCRESSDSRGSTATAGCRRPGGAAGTRPTRAPPKARPSASWTTSTH